MHVKTAVNSYFVGVILASCTQDMYLGDKYSCILYTVPSASLMPSSLCILSLGEEDVLAPCEKGGVLKFMHFLLCNV